MMQQAPWMNYDPVYTIAESIQDNSKYTPDVPIINQFINHYVFVYGTLKRGELRGELLSYTKGSTFCGEGMTEDKNYDMLLSPVDGRGERFPVIMRDTTAKRLKPVKGELWLVTTSTLMRLDRIESNGKMYERNERQVFVGKRKIKAWVYEGVKEFWRMADGLSDVQPTTVNKKEFYDYARG